MDIATLSLEERAVRLRSPISRYPAREPLGWGTHVALDTTIASLGRDAVRDIAAALLKTELTTIAANIDLLPSDNPNDQCVIWYAANDSEDLRKTLAGKPTVIYVVGTQSFVELRAIITDVLTAWPALAGNQFFVVDREHLADELSHHPWWWSTYVGRDMPFVIVEREDEAHLRRALGIARDAPLVAHPAVSRGMNARLVRLEGRPGSGKTYALLHVFGNALQHAIVLRAAAEERHIELCDAILNEVFADRGLVIFDDLDEHMFDAPVRSPLGRLIDRLRTRSNETCMVVVTYDSTVSAKVEQHFGNYWADFTASIVLDDPPHAFIVDVLRAAAAARDVGVDEYTLQRAATILRGWENKPAAAAKYVSAHDPGSHLRIPETINNVLNAPHQKAMSDARFVLRIIAALREAGVDEPAIVTAGLLFEHFIGGKDYARFEEALRQLVEERRIRTTALAIHVAGAEVETLTAADESDFQRRFGDAVDAMLDGIDERDRRALLFSEGERALRTGQADRALALLERLRAEAPRLFSDHQERFAIGFLKAGDSENAVRYLQEYVIQHPEEASWKSVLELLCALSLADQHNLVELGAIDVLLSVYLRPERATAPELDALLDALTTERTGEPPEEHARRDQVIRSVRAWREQLR